MILFPASVGSRLTTTTNLQRGVRPMEQQLEQKRLTGKMPAVLVVHENRGLTPYIQDVVRRLAVANFVAFGPDALTPLGGYPGNDDKGVEMQRTLDQNKIIEDFVEAVNVLQKRPEST